MKMKSDEKLDNCTFVKTILMILIVIYHSCVLWTNNWGKIPEIQAPILGDIAIWLNSFHIYCFTLVSGYIFFFIKYEKNEYQCFKYFVRKKILRLVIPYYIVGCFWVIPIELLLFTTDNYILKYLMGISPSQMWFLLMLFDVFIIVYFCGELIYKNNCIAIIFCVLCYIVGIFGRRFLPNVFQIFTSLQFVPFFVVGMKLRQYTVILDKFMKKKFLLVLCLNYMLFLAIFTFTSFENIKYKIFYYMLNFILHLFGAVISFVILQKIACKTERWKYSHIYNILKKYSFPIYFFHQQIIYFIINEFDGVINPYINFIVNFIIAIIGALMISFVLYRVKWIRILLGQK